MALVAALCLSGCASAPLKETRPALAVSSVEAMIIPPIGGPGIIGVVETRFANAVRQEIALKTETKVYGQNFVTIEAFTDRTVRGSDQGVIYDTPLAELDLAGEAQRMIPAVPMKLSPYFVQNAYGPFGYSVGRADTGDLCIYAWQRIDPDLKPSGAIDRGAVNLRIRICDSKKNEGQLLAFINEMRIGPAVRTPARFAQPLGQFGTTIMPVGVDGLANVAPEPVVIVSEPAAPKVEEAPAVQPVAAPVPSPSGTVPGPDTGNVTVPVPPVSAVPSVTIPPPPDCVAFDGTGSDAVNPCLPDCTLDGQNSALCPSED